MPNIVATIEARMTSSRLPGKVMLPIMGKPMLELMVERVKKCIYINEIIIATTTNETDDCIVELAKKLKIKWFRGSEEDVLDRVLSAAKNSDADIIVELTGDCPLIDPFIIDRVVKTYLDNQADYVSNTLKRTYPRGMDTEVFSTENLERVASISSEPAVREHVSLYFVEHPEEFKQINVESNLQGKWWELRLTVDTNNDFELISIIYNSLYQEDSVFSLNKIIDFLKANENLMTINNHIKQKQVRT